MPIHKVSAISGAKKLISRQFRSGIARTSSLVTSPIEQGAIQHQHIGSTEDDAGGGEEGCPAIDLEGADQRQELTDEARRARQPTDASVKIMKTSAYFGIVRAMPP